MSGSPVTKLETALDGAWKVPQYWLAKPHLLISKIKIRVDEIVNDGFQNGGGRVSIKKIFDVLKAAPFGFMPCNLSAFIMGFVLKEYATGTYSWSDGITNDILNVNKLKEMIDEVIRLEITPNPRYKDKYIVAMTSEEKAFNEITSVAFGIPLNMCTSVPNTRERIRSKMKEYGFPIWTLKHILANEVLQTEGSVLSEIIDSFCGIANSNNMGTSKTDSDIAMAIGKLALSNAAAANDLKSLLTKEKCTLGMLAYLSTFEERLHSLHILRHHVGILTHEGSSVRGRSGFILQHKRYIFIKELFVCQTYGVFAKRERNLHPIGNLTGKMEQSLDCSKAFQLRRVSSRPFAYTISLPSRES